MEIFKIIQTVLEDLFDKIPGANESEKIEKVNQENKRLGSLYSTLVHGSHAPIRYRDPVTRFAYIYKYVTCHSNLVYTAISRNYQIADMLENGRHVNVACIGGGPGSDFLGILKYCEKENKKPTLRCYLYDREDAWGETWCDVDQKAESSLKITTIYQTIDVTEKETWEYRDKYKECDIFTMTYFMSEVYRAKTIAEPFFRHIFAGAKSGSLFMYIDNNDMRFYSWFEALCSAHGLDKISGDERMENLPFEEEKSDLGRFYGMFEEIPKLKANVAWRVARKK